MPSRTSICCTARSTRTSARSSSPSTARSCSRTSRRPAPTSSAPTGWRAPRTRCCGAEGQHEAAVWLLFEALLTEPRDPAAAQRAARARARAARADPARARPARRDRRSLAEAHDVEAQIRGAAAAPRAGRARASGSTIRTSRSRRASSSCAWPSRLRRSSARSSRSTPAIDAQPEELERAVLRSSHALPRRERPAACLQLARSCPTCPSTGRARSSCSARRSSGPAEAAAARAALETLHGASRDAIALATFLEDQAELSADPKRARAAAVAARRGAHGARRPPAVSRRVREPDRDRARLARSRSRGSSARRAGRATRAGCRSALRPALALASSAASRARALRPAGARRRAHRHERAKRRARRRRAARGRERGRRRAAVRAPRSRARSGRGPRRPARRSRRCGPSRALFSAQVQNARRARGRDRRARRAAGVAGALARRRARAPRADALCVAEGGDSAPCCAPPTRPRRRDRTGDLLDAARDALDRLEAAGRARARGPARAAHARRAGRAGPSCCRARARRARRAGSADLAPRARAADRRSRRCTRASRMLFELARVHREHETRRRRSRALLRVLELHPDQGGALARLRELFRAAGDGERLLLGADAPARHQPDVEVRRELRLEACAVSSRPARRPRARRVPGARAGRRERRRPRAHARSARRAGHARRLDLGARALSERSPRAARRSSAAVCSPGARPPRPSSCRTTGWRSRSRGGACCAGRRTPSCCSWSSASRCGRGHDHGARHVRRADRGGGRTARAARTALPLGALARARRHRRRGARALPARLRAGAVERRRVQGDRAARARMRPDRLPRPLLRTAGRGGARPARALRVAARGRRPVRGRARTDPARDRPVATRERRVRALRARRSAARARAPVPQNRRRRGSGDAARARGRSHAAGGELFNAEDKVHCLDRLATLLAEDLDERAAAVARLDEALATCAQESLPEELSAPLARRREALRPTRVPPPPELSAAMDEPLRELPTRHAQPRLPEPEPHPVHVREPESASELRPRALARARSSPSPRAPDRAPAPAAPEPAPDRAAAFAKTPPTNLRARLLGQLIDEPHRVELVRELAGMCAVMNWPAERHVTRQWLSMFDSTVTPAPDPAFHSALYRGGALQRALQDGTRDEVDQFLAALWDFARVIPRFRKSLGDHGVTERERLSRITVGPVAEAYAQAARTLTATHVPVYVSASPSARARALATHPPAVLAGRGVASGHAALLYWLSHALWLADPRRIIAGVLAPEAAVELMEAAKLAFARASAHRNPTAGHQGARGRALAEHAEPRRSASSSTRSAASPTSSTTRRCARASAARPPAPRCSPRATYAPRCTPYPSSNPSSKRSPSTPKRASPQPCSARPPSPPPSARRCPTRSSQRCRRCSAAAGSELTCRARAMEHPGRLKPVRIERLAVGIDADAAVLARVVRRTRRR